MIFEIRLTYLRSCPLSMNTASFLKLSWDLNYNSFDTLSLYSKISVYTHSKKKSITFSTDTARVSPHFCSTLIIQSLKCSHSNDWNRLVLNTIKIIQNITVENDSLFLDNVFLLTHNHIAQL